MAKITEKEKMIKGVPYFAFDQELVEDRLSAKEKVFEINKLHPRELKEKEMLFEKLFNEMDKDAQIELPFRCDYGYNIEIGDHFFANYNCVILDCAKVTIGNNVMFAPNVSLFTAGHPIDASKRREGWEYAFPIIIGNDVWIGGNVVINPGITIGDQVVIGSGSVVTKDIPSNSIAVGNPCKVIREITKEDQLYYFKNMEF